MSAPHKRPAFEPAERLLAPTRYDPDMKRPPTTVAGATLVLLRVLVGIGWLVEVGVSGGAALGSDVARLDPEVAGATAVLAIVIVGSGLLIDAVLAFLILRGRNWSRVVVMAIAVISITAAFVSWWSLGQSITIRTTLPSVALDILVLLALSSRSAAAYARRNERH